VPLAAYRDPVAIEDDAGGGTSGVSWAAVFAGATAAAALSLVLVILGFGLGLSSVSPWTGASASATAIGVGTIVWLAFTQLAASGMGGYLAGRLRSRWMRVHTDEVYFRDTAHGFLAWAVASLVTAAFLGSAITAALGTGVQAGATVAGAAAAGTGVAATTAATKDGAGERMGYYVDSLFRSSGTNASAPTDTNAAPAAASAAQAQDTSSSRREAVAIFAHDLKAGTLPADDRTYLGQVIARQTGISQQDAEKRVDDGFAKVKDAENQAKQAIDTARKAAANAALWMFVALMFGAFFASFFATYGGKRRDLFV